VGTGKDCTIKELALLIKEISGFQGNLEFDTTKPDGYHPPANTSSVLNRTGLPIAGAGMV
jgi:GDP-L-fucose synthase